jgi:hypothetical protein
MTTRARIQFHSSLEGGGALTESKEEQYQSRYCCGLVLHGSSELIAQSLLLGCGGGVKGTISIDPRS